CRASMGQAKRALLPLPRTSAQPHHSITSSARASSVGGTSRPSAFAVLEVDHDFMLGWPQLVDRPVSRRGVAYTGDYCFGGTRVDCQDTNCTPWPRLAHTLWNRTCSERSPPLTVRSNSKKPVIMARQQVRTLTSLRRIARYLTVPDRIDSMEARLSPTAPSTQRMY